MPPASTELQHHHLAGLGLVLLGLYLFGGDAVGSILLAGVATSSTACMDTDAQCGAWAQAGQCDTNAEWMLANCRLSCTACQPAAAAPTTGPETTMPAPCVDSDAEQCPQWKAKGDCASNSEWMLANCRLSCGVCNPPAAQAVAAPPAKVAEQPCADSDTQQCPRWKANGDCASNSEWMLANCRLSCGVCKPPVRYSLIYDGQHPKADAKLGGCIEGLTGSTEAAIVDACGQQCKQNDQCRFFWVEVGGNRPGYCCLKYAFDRDAGVRPGSIPDGRFYQMD